ncbi:MAG: metal ABC transporter substrate-binding protein [Succinivibrio sp.]
MFYRIFELKKLAFVKKALFVLTIFCMYFFNSAFADDLRIVAASYPQYDLVRHITGDKIKVDLLLKPGMEAHSYEPTPREIISISKAALFVYNGGENDEWVEDLIENTAPLLNRFTFTGAVNLLPEETVEGMQEESHEHEDDEEEVEYDEHVWTSPVNDIIILKKLCEKISALDPDNAAYYQENTNAYIREFEDLDRAFKEIRKNAHRDTIIFADRFPFLYFAKQYSLKYYAAFKGCSNDTEVSAGTVRFLIDKTKELDISVILKLEQSNDAVASSVAESTGAKVMIFNSGHNVTTQQLSNNVSLVDLYRENLQVLKSALN